MSNNDISMALANNSLTPLLIDVSCFVHEYDVSVYIERTLMLYKLILFPYILPYVTTYYVILL